MNRTLSIGRSGLETFQKKMDSIANNVANSQTIGYKKTDVHFNELLRDEIALNGIPLSDEILEKAPTQGLGVKGGEAFRIYEQGALIQSERNLDLAIEGEGFFKVTDDQNNFFLTRIGNFQVNEKGDFVDGNGYKLDVDDLDDLTDYNVKSISIASDGTIEALDSDGESEKVGQIVIYDLIDKSKFEDVGKGYLKGDGVTKLTDSLSDDGLGMIRQGYNEISNVDLGEEMVQMIMAQRAYQMNLKSVQTADEMMSMVNNIKR